MASEKRLIDANALWVSLDQAGLFESGNPRHIAQQTVEEQPTVDAVEVVRCKDCKHREDGMCPMESVCQYPWFATKNDGFCSYGERREGNV